MTTDDTSPSGEGRDPAGRRSEIEKGLERVRRRIAAGCLAAGRSPDDVVLVAVTKFFPATDITILHDLGVRHVGESRDQEARAKHDDPALAGLELTWHFIGQLQTNKVRSVLTYADVIHTADRPKLVRSLASAADAAGRRPRVLVQVDLDTPPATSPGPGRTGPAGSRGGAAPGDVAALADQVAAAGSLELGGVMAVAPLPADGADPAAAADTAFGRLTEVARTVEATHPAATWVSAGMSGDLEAAIRHGATHLRVGSAILGSRPTLR